MRFLSIAELPSGDLRRWLRENWPHFSTSKLRHLWGKNVHVFHKNSVRYEAKLLGNSNISLNFDSILRQVCGKNIICFMESYASHERNLPHLFKLPPPGLIEIYKFSLNFWCILRQVCGKNILMENNASHEGKLPHLFKQPPPGLIEIYKFSLNFQWILRQVCGKNINWFSRNLRQSWGKTFIGLFY